MSRVGSMEDVKPVPAQQANVTVVHQTAGDQVTMVDGIVAIQPSKPVILGYPQQLKEWDTGLCDCCDDPGACCLTCCCMACVWCSITSRMEEQCCVAYCVHGGTTALRTKFRTQHALTGSICKDCCATSLCCCLVVCQLDRQLKEFGHY